MPPTVDVVRAGGHEVALHRWGRAGPLVVLVHGIGVSHRYFRPLAEALAAAGCRVLAPDLPGFGASPRPSRVLTVEEHAAVVADLVRAAASADGASGDGASGDGASADGASGHGANDGVNGPRPVLVGHSMGAQVVAAAAAADPGLVERVLLLGPVTEPRARSAVRQGWRLLRDALRESPAANAVVFSDYVRCGPRRYLATLPSMLTWRLEDHLADVAEPVVLLRGRRDPVAPSAYVHRLALRARDAAVVEVPGEGHVLMWRRPDAVVPWVLGERDTDGVLPDRGRSVASGATERPRPTRAPRARRRAPGPGKIRRVRRDGTSPVVPGADVTTGSPAGRHSIRRVRDVVRRGWWWARDYAWVGWWQVVGALGRGDGAELREPAGRRRRPDVVLVPGVYEPWSFLRPLAERLRDRGHAVHVLPALGYNRGPVVEAAGLLGTYLRDADLRDVVVVAHSKGGLIGKRAMLDEGPDGRIAAMVAVATPFGGSRYAQYLPFRTLRAFAPTDGTLRALAAELAVNARITSAYSRFDPHIPGGSELAGAVNVELRTPGHFRVLADPELDAVLDAAFERAVADRPARPAAGDAAQDPRPRTSSGRGEPPGSRRSDDLDVGRAEA